MFALINARSKRGSSSFLAFTAFINGALFILPVGFLLEVLVLFEHKRVNNSSDEAALLDSILTCIIYDYRYSYEIVGAFNLYNGQGFDYRPKNLAKFS